MTKYTMMVVTILTATFISHAAFADSQTDASFCGTIETGTATHDRPVCSAVEHLQAALKEMQGLPADGDDHKKLALKATQSALEEIQSYTSPMIIADPVTNSETEQK